MNNITVIILDAILYVLDILPTLIIIFLLCFTIHLLCKILKPNPFDRTIGKKPYSIKRCYIELHKTRRYNSNLLYTALSDMVYTYNAAEFDLTLCDSSDVRHNLQELQLFPITNLDLSHLGSQYDEEFVVAHSLAEKISIPPFSRSVSFDLTRNINLKQLILPCHKPIPISYIVLDRQNPPIIVSEGFTIYVPAMQLSAYQQAEIWQRREFCTADGTPVPLRFEAIP